MTEPLTKDQPRIDIIGIGAATLDEILLVEEFPGEEGVTQVISRTAQGGGPVATALCAITALETEASDAPSPPPESLTTVLRKNERIGATLQLQCALLDAQGDDPAGVQIRAELQKRGISTAHIRVDPGAASAHATVLVRKRDGARHILFLPASTPELAASDVPDALIRPAKLLHINGRHEAAARAAVRIAREAGVPVSFDGGAGRYRDSIRDLVLGSSIRIVAREFAMRFAGTESLEDAAAALRVGRMELLVITDGARGSWTWTKDGDRFHQPAFTAKEVVDTTGCGDVFHGAFLLGWLRGWQPRRTAEFASREAARNAEGLGGRFAL